ncbi:MAG: DinB family protein [Defluviitaleaceae bacterium]|nr:DinB family protein [Defluviitaleaceae bacterium]
MITSLQSQFKIWSYARANTIRFLTQLSDSELGVQLPRKTFVTIFEQIAEMVWVQKCFLDGIEAGQMNDTDWTVPVFGSKANLFAEMTRLDGKMAELLERCDGTEEVFWNNRSRNIHEVVSLMQMHETMHLGQIIAFCHALGIDIPQDVTKALFLTGSNKG